MNTFLNPSKPLSTTVLPSLGHEQRYDTRVCDFGSLTPFADPGRPGSRGHAPDASFWKESLALAEKYLPFTRRKFNTNDGVYACGETFDSLCLISAGLFKVVNLTQDGREQPAGMYFKGDWLGFDGIPNGRHSCSAIAMDRGEVWSIRYDSLLQASTQEPIVMRLLLAAMSGQLARNRDAMLAMGTLTADARVADFLLKWAHALEERGLRTDQFNVHMTRADIGRYLGLTLESVSRALSRMARCGVIEFNEKGRRDISIPCLKALHEFILESTDHSRVLQ
jgi:CRP/FNR family transcriptional regulator, anaerobic regulatory protein